VWNLQKSGQAEKVGVGRVLVPACRLVVLEDEGERKVLSAQAPVDMQKLVSGYYSP
jgi:hypothetical protein